MKRIRRMHPVGFALVPALVAVALGVTIAIAGVSGDDGDQPPAAAPTWTPTWLPGLPVDTPPGAAAPTWTPTWLPGLPIDTPPAEPSAVYVSPPPGQAASWQTIAEIAYAGCSGFGIPPSNDPDAMYETTAGEIRRRIASTGVDATYALGSSWANEDRVYVVAFRGDYTSRMLPPPAMNEEPKEFPHSDICIFMGTGSPSDQVGISTLRDYEPTIENLFGKPQ